MSSSIKFLIFLVVQAFVILLITKLAPFSLFETWAENRTDAAHYMFLFTDLLALAVLCFFWNCAYRRAKAKRKLAKSLI